jgi:hypothetical protein
MRALQPPAVFEVLQHGRELRTRVLLKKLDTLLRERPVQDLRLLERPLGHLDANAPAILLIPNTPGIPGTLDPVERRGHRATRQAGGVRQCAGRHGAGLRQHAQTPEIGAVEPQTPRDRFVDLVGRILEGLNTPADGRKKFVLRIVRDTGCASPPA